MREEIGKKKRVRWHSSNKGRAQKSSKTVGGFVRTPVCVLSTDHHSSVGWMALAVSVTLVLMAGLAFWLWKHWWVLCMHPSCPFSSVHLAVHPFSSLSHQFSSSQPSSFLAVISYLHSIFVLIRTHHESPNSVLPLEWDPSCTGAQDTSKQT